MKPKVLVVGDAMWDHYHFATATRISPEAPIPVFSVYDQKMFSGGARNVKANLDVLGADTKLVSGLTPTTQAGFYSEPRKHRIVVGNTQVVRWDEDDKVEPIDLEQLDQAILRWKPDAIIISDYGKGSISKEVIEWIFAQDVWVYIDTKRDPAEFSYFAAGATPEFPYEAIIFFPNQHEYDQFPSYTEHQNVVLKRSEKGIQFREFGKVDEEYPAWATNVVSVTGAGDTVIGAYAYAYLRGYKPLPFANAAAACSVSKPYTSTVTEKEVEEVLARQGLLSAVLQNS